MATTFSERGLDDDSWLYASDSVKDIKPNQESQDGDEGEKNETPATEASIVRETKASDNGNDAFSDDDDDDDVQVTIGEIKPVVPDMSIKAKHIPGAAVKGIDINAQGMINGVPTYDFDIQSLAVDERPWRKPGADITDFFNYGFNEESWALYCAKQQKVRTQDAPSSSQPKNLLSGILTPALPNLNQISSSVHLNMKRDPAAISVIGATPKNSRRPTEMNTNLNNPLETPEMLHQPFLPHQLTARPPPGFNVPPPSIPRPGFLHMPIGPPPFLPTPFDPNFFSASQQSGNRPIEFPMLPYPQQNFAVSTNQTTSFDNRREESDYSREHKRSPRNRSPSISNSDDEYSDRGGRVSRYHDRDRRRSSSRDYDRRRRGRSKEYSRTRDRDESRGKGRDRSIERFDDRHKSSRSSKRYNREDEDDDSDHKSRHKKTRHSKKTTEDKSEKTESISVTPKND